MRCLIPNDENKSSSANLEKNTDESGLGSLPVTDKNL